MLPQKVTIDIAGLQVHVYACSRPATSSALVVIFLLHGRLSSAEKIEPIAESLVKLAQEAGQQRQLLVVTFDQRNHGTRLVDWKVNNAWSSDKTENNDRHAIDMYSIQTGTARDISFLIDFLPSYLFPLGERSICEWGVAGVSLGGHATWITLSHEPRVTIGIPIIGCPDYLSLISHRASQLNLPTAPPYIPTSLLNLIQQSDPASMPYQSLDSSNPFLGKKILILSGREDALVPWSMNHVFVDELEVGEMGVKKVIIQENTGHECTNEMVEEAAAFIRELLASKCS